MCTGSDLVDRVAREQLSYAENLVSGDMLGGWEDVCSRAVSECGVQGVVCVHGGSLGSGVGAGVRCLTQRVGGVCWSAPPLYLLQECGGSLRVDAWGAGRRGVFPRCGVGHAWTLGLVRRPVAISGLLLRSSSGARRNCCVGGGCSTERFLTMSTLRVPRS